MHELIVYKGNEKTGQLEYIHRWQFQINPAIKVLDLVEEIDGVKVSKKGKIEDRILTNATKALQRFLFKIDVSPIGEPENTVWFLSDFTDEDKKQLMRLSLMYTV